MAKSELKHLFPSQMTSNKLEQSQVQVKEKATEVLMVCDTVIHFTRDPGVPWSINPSETKTRLHKTVHMSVPNSLFVISTTGSK